MTGSCRRGSGAAVCTFRAAAYAETAAQFAGSAPPACAVYTEPVRAPPARGPLSDQLRAQLPAALRRAFLRARLASAPALRDSAARCERPLPILAGAGSSRAKLPVRCPSVLPLKVHPRTIRDVRQCDRSRIPVLALHLLSPEQRRPMLPSSPRPPT